MKILIIGQAPPAQKQEYPYDTTLLYDMLKWVGITKEQAQDMFDFEAMASSLRGVKNGQHLKPLKKEMKTHWQSVLLGKVKSANKIILLGTVAKETCTEFGVRYWCKNILELPHPSRRNYVLIMGKKGRNYTAIKRFFEITSISPPHKFLYRCGL